MKDLVQVWYSKPTLVNAAEAVVELYGSSLVGGVPARGNNWHITPHERRDRRPYYTKILYEENVEDLKRKISRQYDEKYYKIEFIEV